MSLFVVLFCVLILPVPGIRTYYSEFFMSLGRLAFSNEDSDRVVQFHAHEEHHDFSTLDIEMIVGNRRLADSQGKGPVQMSSFDTRSIGYLPTALTLCLVIATPIPWRRKVLSLILSFLLINAFILFSLQVRIWVISPELSLVEWNPAIKYVLDQLDYTLLTQMGASFSMPVIIWATTTFRLRDFTS